MKNQIKGLRKLSTEEMEKVKGGFPVIDFCRIAEAWVRLSDGEDFIQAVDNWLTLEGVCW